MGKNHAESVELISQLNIKDIAKDQAWIFLWTTQRYIFDVKNILEQKKRHPSLFLRKVSQDVKIKYKDLKPNLEIRIPANVSSIIEKFEQLNQ